MSFRGSLILSALFILISAGAWAAQHPVPLDKGVKDDKCLECHEDKSKGKVVHPAVGMGCLSCHMVRGSGDATRVVLKNGRPATLCFSCHDDKRPAKAKGHVHPPSTTDCLKCHDPHVSANEKLLLKPVTGGKNENLCLSCHNQGVDVPKEGSRHAALDMGCTTCHTTHKTGERGKQEFDFHLTKSTPALCIDCHSLDDKALIEAHQNQPLAGADCVQCHDPHQSKSPKLMQANLHAPFEGGKSSCETCHQAPKDGKVVLTQPDSKALCASCHDEVAKKIDSAKVQHPGAQGDCVACHDPHAGKSPRFMKTNGVAACLSCHSEQAEMLAKNSTLHDPAFNQNCSICHEAHGGTHEKLLKDDADSVCLSCHGPDAKALKAEDGTHETVLGKKIVVPTGYVLKAAHIELTPQRLNHPVPGHPVGGYDDPRNKGKKLSCLSCHNPHGGQARYMLTSEHGSQRTLCGQCHENMRPEEHRKNLEEKMKQKESGQ